MSCKIKGLVVGGVMLAIIVIIIAVVAKCFRKLDTSEVAITYNSYTKKLSDEVYYEGLHIGSPFRSFIKFPSVFQTLSYDNKQCLNEDGVTVTLSVSMQYKIRPSHINVIVAQFKDEKTYINMLNTIGSSAVHDVCCLFNTTQLQAERGRFQEELEKTLTNKFTMMHTDVTDVQVNNIIRPRKYENAIRAKESAREDIQVALNEAPRLQTEATTKKREAKSEADIIENQADSDAKILLNKAKAEAQGILNDYMKEAESYKQLKSANGLDNKGFLAYLGIRVIANSKNPVHIGMSSPAETSFLN